MTYREDFTLPTELLEQVSQQGFDILPELIRIVVNAAMHAERQQYLKAAPYQRTPERETYANGYKPKTIQTRVGNITFSVPQVREGAFYPEALEKGLRSERALTLALAEMYVQGVSTRKVKAITEQLCGVFVLSTQVSNAAHSWTANWRSGVNDRWGNTLTCTWMPIMSRSEKMDRYAIWPFWLLWVSIVLGNWIFWAFPSL